MKDLKLKELMKQPDMSQIKPPTEHAVRAMLRNLHTAAKKQQ